MTTFKDNHQNSKFAISTFEYPLLCRNTGKIAELKLNILKNALIQNPKKATNIIESFKRQHAEVVNTVQNRDSIYFGQPVPAFSVSGIDLLQNKKDLSMLQAVLGLINVMVATMFPEKPETLYLQRVSLLACVVIWITMYYRGSPQLSDFFSDTIVKDIKQIQKNLEETCRQLLLIATEDTPEYSILQETLELKSTQKSIRFSIS